MPKILDRLVKQLKDKGMSESAAYAVATKQLQKSGNLKKGTQEATSKGLKRGDMTPSERSKDRESKYSSGKHKPSEYRYNPKTSTSKLKKGKK